MLKNKRFLLTILLALVAIMLVQLQVKATEVDYSEYDYLLTETGVIAKNDLTETETVIAGIKGEYTGTISLQSTNVLKISNFNANTLKIFKRDMQLWIDGVNNIHKFDVAIIEQGEDYIVPDELFINSNSDGKLTCYCGNSGLVVGNIKLAGWEINNGTWIDGEWIAEENYYSGSYVYEMGQKEFDNVDLTCNLSGVTQIDWEEIKNIISINVDELFIYFNGETVIPSTVFQKLKSFNNKTIRFQTESALYTFNSWEINNINANLTTGYSIEDVASWNMVDVEKDDVIYINFNHSGTIPAPLVIDIWGYCGFSEEGETLKCYYFNEETKMYEQVENAKMINYATLLLNIDHCSKYVVSKTELPAELVDSSNNEVTDEKWCVETEVDSLVWTEEDINKILADIEETRNNTTEKKLYIHVPSGSKVPAKIFEASNGIDITIISEDGIWAEFSGGSYKAIDYVAGGTISNKAIDGMVNVGEDTIVYLSLKHEGELPSLCVISYLQGHTEIGLGGEFNFVETKLYYFNKDVQKYELCGTGTMDLAYDLYVFEIDHCSSYVMSEEPLPDEFVIKTATGENKEENKREETKKEEAKTEDTTKAPGSLPYTGGTFVIIVSVLAIIALGIYAYRRNHDLKGI